MAGYLGSEAAFVSVAIADIEGDLTVGGGLTSRGIDDNATSTAMTLDSSGNVLVGKTQNDFTLAGSIIRPGGEALLTREGDLLTLNRLTSDGNIVSFRKDDSPVGSIGVASSRPTFVSDGGLTYDAGFRLYGTNVSGLQAMHPYDGSGSTDGLLDLGRDTSRFKNLYLSGGVYLGGTSGANKLDDYEEGTWTPSIVGEVTTSNGTYTKVGTLVTANFYITLPNIGFSTDPALIDGLPFTANTATAARRSAGFLAYNSDGKAASLLFETGGSRVGFRNDPNGTAQDRGTVAGNTYYGTLIYNTDS